METSTERYVPRTLSQHNVCLWVSACVSICCKKGMILKLQSIDPERLGIKKGSRGDIWLVLQEEVSLMMMKNRIYDYSRIPLGVILLFFFVFLQVSRFYIVSGFWSPKQCWEWVLSRGMVLKSKQTFVGYSHNFCATIALEYLTGRAGHGSKALWSGQHFYFSLGSLHSTFPQQRH